MPERAAARSPARLIRTIVVEPCGTDRSRSASPSSTSWPPNDRLASAAVVAGGSLVKVTRMLANLGTFVTRSPADSFGQNWRPGLRMLASCCYQAVQGGGVRESTSCCYRTRTARRLAVCQMDAASAVVRATADAASIRRNRARATGPFPAVITTRGGGRPAQLLAVIKDLRAST